MGALSEKAPAKLESMDGAEMAHEERQTVVKNWREVSPGKCDQGAKPSRVCCHNEGKAGREGKRKAVCSATKKHCKEDREA